MALGLDVALSIGWLFAYGRLKMESLSVVDVDAIAMWGGS
jgi:hypothetical protein